MTHHSLPNSMPWNQDPTYPLQVVLIGVVLPLAFFFLLEAQQELTAPILCKLTASQRVTGTIQDLSDTHIRVAYPTPTDTRVKDFDRPPGSPSSLKPNCAISVRYATYDAQIAVLEGQEPPWRAGLWHLALGSIFAAIALKFGLYIWRTPETRPQRMRLDDAEPPS